MDLAKPLVSRVQVGGLSQAIEYEALHTVCFSCGVVGHRIDQCSNKSSEPVRTAIPATMEQEQGNSSKMETKAVTENCGPWMLVKRKFWKGSTNKGKSQHNGRSQDSNRFKALDSLENLEEDCPVNDEVIEAWNKGVSGESARLSFKEVKEKARKGKGHLVQDSPSFVPETQLDPALMTQNKIIPKIAGSSSILAATGHNTQVRPLSSKSRVKTKLLERPKPYSYPAHNRKALASKAQSQNPNDSIAWIPKQLVPFGPLTDSKVSSAVV